MTVDKNIYPDVTVLENVTFTKKVTEVTEYSDYIDKTIFYCGCNTPYLSFMSTDNIKRTNTEGGLKHTFKSGETTKHDICLSTSDYTGGLYAYNGEEHDIGWHGGDNTLINHFDITKCYLDLDELYINTISLEHANMTGSEAVYQNDTAQYTMNEYLALENKPLIMSWSGITVKGVPSINIYPLLCRKTDFYNAYTPTCISYRSNVYNYVSDRAYGGTSANDRYYAVQTDWNNLSNTSILFYNSDTEYLSGNAIVGLPSDCEIFTPIGSGETEYNYFIPEGYDYSDAPMPALYYWSNWQTYYFNLYSFDYFLKMVSSTGLRFKLNNIMYASEINSDGYTTGRYIPVTELANSDFFNKDWTASENSNYDADKKPKHDIENDLEDIGLNENTGNSKFIRWYALTPTQMTDFQEWLNSDERPIGFDAMKNIIGVTEYMTDLSDVSYLVNTSAIKIGTEVYGSFGGDTVGALITNITRTKELGSITIERYNNDFTDYEPYSTYDVYIPYVNWVHLDADIIVGKKITVYLIEDILTGACKGIVMCEGNIIAEGNGTFGNTVPISSNNVGQYKQALLNNALSIGSGVIASASGIASGNAVGTASGLLSLASGISQSVALKHTSFTDVKGQTATATMYNTYDKCVLAETHPVENITTQFAHSVGFITNKTKLLEQCKGYTVCDNVDTTGLTCTQTEKDIIKQMLETGCYL